MCRKVVNDQEVAGPDFLGKCVGDVTFEDYGVHGPIDHGSVCQVVHICFVTLCSQGHSK